jgi:type II secretory pathway pseudopilin PulG
MTLVELIIVIAIITVLIVVAVSSLLRARMNGNELSAVASLRVINSAQTNYGATCGGGGFAISLTALGQPGAGGGQGFLDRDLSATPIVGKSGYVITSTPGRGAAFLTSRDCHGNPVTSNYYASAAPSGTGQGTRSFATNQGGVVFERAGTTPPQEPFGPPATPVK